eukprot:TRINITY_DN3033_c1_g1_i1.p1 TRINITY_DN3033_c1_g1~~TRINITY_DN3033_c1_g1_i1.p1  ORF type:complete len:535 (+),score=157.27 TRINITY_DN3033_c1_g1_i1:62-1666(+)
MFSKANKGPSSGRNVFQGVQANPNNNNNNNTNSTEANVVKQQSNPNLSSSVGSNNPLNVGAKPTAGQKFGTASVGANPSPSPQGIQTPVSPNPHLLPTPTSNSESTPSVVSTPPEIFHPNHAPQNPSPLPPRYQSPSPPMNYQQSPAPMQNYYSPQQGPQQPQQPQQYSGYVPPANFIPQHYNPQSYPQQPYYNQGHYAPQQMQQQNQNYNIAQHLHNVQQQQSYVQQSAPQPPIYAHQQVYQPQQQQQQQQQQAKQITPQPPQSGPMVIDDDYEVDHSELQIEKEIARGSYGIVYSGTFRGTEVAIKKMLVPKMSEQELKDFHAEVNIMKKLHHPNVVLLMAVCSTPPNLAFVTELMVGSLWGLLHDKSMNLDLKTQIRLITDTARGMNYLHLFKPAVVHRDLKSPNLLVDKYLNIKIADFGLSKVKSSLMTGNLGTCQYMAPEVIQSSEYTEKADVFSFAIVMWEVLSRQVPYQGVQALQLAYGIIHQNKRLPIDPSWNKELVQIMSMSWEREPVNRPSFSDILQMLKQIKS